MGTIGFGACMMCYWLKFGLQCSGIVWAHYYHHSFIMALLILCLCSCLHHTEAYPASLAGPSADSSAWVQPIASRLDDQHNAWGNGVKTHTTAPPPIASYKKDDRVITDHTGSYMPIPPSFYLVAELTLRYPRSLFTLSALFLLEFL